MISDPLIKDIRLQPIYCDETGVNKITPALQLVFHLLQPNAGGFLLAGRRRSVHLKGVDARNKHFFPSSGTLKPRFNCPTAKPLVFKPELFLALECCIFIITTYINLKKKIIIIIKE